jgi:hypothetical protein
MRVFYLRDKQKSKGGKLIPGKPVVAVASEFSGNEIVFSVATWNPKDKYKRSTLYNKAVGRLEGKQFEGQVSSEWGIKERILRFIVAAPDSQSRKGSFIGYRTKKYAQQWLDDMEGQELEERYTA